MGRPQLKIGIVIQARMGSARLPGKVLMPVGDRLLLEHVVAAARAAGGPSSVVVATSTASRDEAIVQKCAEIGVLCFRGSENDVLSRYLECGRHHGFSDIVRLTADNPFTDVEELRRLMRLHVTGRFAYSHSFGQLPIGVGAEAFSMVALERADKEGLESHHREHVNEYFLENPSLFPTGVLDIPASKTAPSLRLTIDTPDDYRLACDLAEGFAGRSVSTAEAIARCSHSA